MNKRLRFPLFGGGVSYFSDSPYVPHSFSTCPVHPRRFPVQCGWEGRKLAPEAGRRAGGQAGRAGSTRPEVLLVMLALHRANWSGFSLYGELWQGPSACSRWFVYVLTGIKP